MIQLVGNRGFEMVSPVYLLTLRSQGWEVQVSEALEVLGTSLLPNSNSAQEGRKTVVGTYAVEAGVNRQHDHAVRPIFYCLVEPTEGLLLFSQKDVCSRPLIGAYIAPLGQLLQVLQRFRCLRLVSGKACTCAK